MCRLLKANMPPDFIRRVFFALELRKRMADNITYLHGNEGRAHINTIENFFTAPCSSLCIKTDENLINRGEIL